jgi:hypothetical protein
LTVGKEHLLTSVDIARFVARGSLFFEGLVPERFNRAFLDEVERSGPPRGNDPGTRLADCYEGTPVREILDLPRLQGIIKSLLGPDPLFDHHGVHFSQPAKNFESRGIKVHAQHTHQDSTIDVRRAFDVQLFYFPQAVTQEMGGTRYLPGSHLRIVNEATISRYQNFVGQQKVVCSAGSVLACHHGLWHGGEVNRSDTMRYMLKLRIAPSVAQVRHWKVDDLTEEAIGARPIFDPTHVASLNADDIRTILCRPEPWYELDTGRLEFINRIRLWRYLVGDDRADIDHWLGRIENDPGVSTT